MGHVDGMRRAYRDVGDVGGLMLLSKGRSGNGDDGGDDNREGEGGGGGEEESGGSGDFSRLGSPQSELKMCGTGEVGGRVRFAGRREREEIRGKAEVGLEVERDRHAVVYPRLVGLLGEVDWKGDDGVGRKEIEIEDRRASRMSFGPKARGLRMEKKRGEEKSRGGRASWSGQHSADRNYNMIMAGEGDERSVDGDEDTLSSLDRSPSVPLRTTNNNKTLYSSFMDTAICNTSPAPQSSSRFRSSHPKHPGYPELEVPHTPRMRPSRASRFTSSNSTPAGAKSPAYVFSQHRRDDNSPREVDDVVNDNDGDNVNNDVEESEKHAEGGGGGGGGERKGQITVYNGHEDDDDDDDGNSANADQEALQELSPNVEVYRRGRRKDVDRARIRSRAQAQDMLMGDGGSCGVAVDECEDGDERVGIMVGEKGWVAGGCHASKEERTEQRDFWRW